MKTQFEIYLLLNKIPAFSDNLKDMEISDDMISFLFDNKMSIFEAQDIMYNLEVSMRSKIIKTYTIDGNQKDGHKVAIFI
jgi:hypothetical protein